jgi:AmmeMemoRadiSam system protein B/AmmeMemoRadiSam system protein A
MKRVLVLWLLVTVIVTGVWVYSCYAVKGSEGVRLPAVAGMFYSDSPDKLRGDVSSFLKTAGGVEVTGKIRGLVSPHAGYIYSGVVAAAGYRQVDPSIKTVFLLGSSHRIPLGAPSIPAVQAYQTPLGRVPLSKLASTLRNSPGFVSVIDAHLQEHSLEVQLPFLQLMLKDFEIVPILINSSDPKVLAETLAPHITEDTLIVASTDLSHYYSYETAVPLDRVCTTAITGGKFSDMPLCEACGKQAVLTLMHIAKTKGWRGVLLDYKNSGDTAGSKNRVVGYASIAFVEGKEMTNAMKEILPAQDREALLRLARSVIEARLVEGVEVDRPRDVSPVFNEMRGCFVTLHKNGQLRGCIGTIEPTCSLIECVERNAKNAAFSDPRFPALSEKELKEVDIEISVLSVPRTLTFKDGEELKGQLEPNVHGVILSQGMHRSTFLPQVWKQLPKKEKFLEHLCLKGGMSATAWQEPKTKVEVYTAEVFGELGLK